MVEHQSKEIVDKISQDLKIQPALRIPREIEEKIKLVYNVNPERLVFMKHISLSDGTAITIHTTHATKDTFIIGAWISAAKDAVNASIRSDIRLLPFGETTEELFLAVRYEPLTVASGLHANISLPMPFKLAKGSAIRLLNAESTASIDSEAGVYLFEVDPQ